jgi:hypothetical protein
MDRVKYLGFSQSDYKLNIRTRPLDPRVVSNYFNHDFICPVCRAQNPALDHGEQAPCPRCSTLWFAAGNSLNAREDTVPVYALEWLYGNALCVLYKYENIQEDEPWRLDEVEILPRKRAQYKSNVGCFSILICIILLIIIF